MRKKKKEENKKEPGNPQISWEHLSGQVSSARTAFKEEVRQPAYFFILHLSEIARDSTSTAVLEQQILQKY